MNRLRIFQYSPLVLGIVGVCTGLILIFLILFTPSIPSSNNRAAPTPTKENTEDTKTKQYPKNTQLPKLAESTLTTPPSIMIDSYTESLNTKSLTPPKPLIVYNVVSVTDERVRSKLYSILGSDPVVKEYGSQTIATATTSTSMRTLAINRSTDSFSIIATDGIPLGDGDRDNALVSFAQSLGYTGQTVTISASYKRQSTPDLTFYELRHSWAKLNAPYLSAYGIENTQGLTKPSTLNLTSQSDNWQKNADIVSTSDGTDGYNRRSDFNTLTIAVHDSSSRVYAVQSTLKHLNASGIDTTITYEAAKQLLDRKQEAILLVKPAGQGVVAWNKVFPNNRAQAKKAVIDDAVLAYLDPTSLPSRTLEPYWIMTGTMELASGYRSAFLSAVPAGMKATPRAQLIDLLIPPAYARGTQQSSFEIGTPSGQIAPTTPASTEKPVEAANCAPSSSDLNPIYDVNNMKIGYFDPFFKNRPAALMGGYPHEWYYIPTRPVNFDQFMNDYAVIKQDFNRILAVNAGESAGSLTRVFGRTMDILSKDILAHATSFCPTRMTGASPTLFVYSQSTTPITVNMKDIRITYSDPPLTSDQWSTQPLTQSRYYYEYEKGQFTQARQGWNTRKSELNKLVNHIASKLALTQIERERLLFELNHAASDIFNENIFIGLIDAQEINEKIPLHVSSASVTVSRYHFAVTPARSIKPEEPSFAQVNRTGSYILELGATSQER